MQPKYWNDYLYKYFTDECEFCHSNINEEEFSKVSEYVKRVWQATSLTPDGHSCNPNFYQHGMLGIMNGLCMNCLMKFEANEIKITMSAWVDHYFIDRDRDNSCDRCHNLFNNSELKRTFYQCEGADEYLCCQCFEIAKEDPRTKLYRYLRDQY